MEALFLGSGIALCLFSLWALARHDWLRLARPMRRVHATVAGHRRSWENSARSYAAIYRFSDGSSMIEVIDPLHRSFAVPAVGEVVELAYPEGRPDLARPPRPVLWAALYLVLLLLIALLAATALGWVD